MSELLYLLAIIMGILTGGITSLIGASGVMVVVPILALLFGVSTHMAIGTSLFVDVIASVTVAYNYYKNDNTDLRSGIWMAVASVVGAQFGASFAGGIGDHSLSEFFGIALVLSGVFMLLKNPKGKKDSLEIITGLVRFRKEWHRMAATFIVGLGIGIISGLIGAGGGVMILIALIVLLSFPLHKAIGTSTFIMAVTALSSSIGYGMRGNINYVLGGFLAFGAVIGGLAGSRIANKINEKTLKKAVGLCFMVIGIAMTVLEFL